MVSSKLFKQMHKLLNKIFSSRQDFPFGRKPALYYEDPYHLLLFRAKPVFAFKNAETMKGFINMDLSRKFKLAKLNQLMRQDDKMFANVLNKIKIGKIDLNIRHIIHSRFFGKNDLSYLGNVLHIFYRNKTQLKETMPS